LKHTWFTCITGMSGVTIGKADWKQ